MEIDGVGVIEEVEDREEEAEREIDGVTEEDTDIVGVIEIVGLDVILLLVVGVTEGEEVGDAL